MVGSRSHRSPIAALAFALMLVIAAIPPATSAQDDTVTVYLQPWDATAGTVISHMCLSLQDASNVGCDENGDGYIAFQDMHPGTYTVVQETTIAGIEQLGDATTITVTDSPSEQYFTISFNELGSETPTPVPDDTVTIFLQPVIAETGVALTPMCLKLGDASNTGCDENGDGSIEFQGIHPGTYPVLQERVVAGVQQLGDTTITVADSPSEQYFTIEFHEMDQGATTPAPTVAPTMAAPTPSSSQSSGSPSGATSLPNTGSGVASSDTFSLATMALLAFASLATLGGGVLRWWSRRRA